MNKKCRTNCEQSRARFFQRPLIAPIGVAMTMRRKKPSAMFPKPRPDFFSIGPRQIYFSQSFPREKFKSSFAMNRRQRVQFLFHLKQKHQPVALAEIAVLAHDT